MIIDSAAQMVESQTCNNSIKLTSLCFHRARYTQRHPLEFHIIPLFTLHPLQGIILRVTTTVCVARLITWTFQGEPASTPQPSHYHNTHLSRFPHGDADSGRELGGSGETTEARPKQNPYLILCSHLDMYSFKSA